MLKFWRVFPWFVVRLGFYLDGGSEDDDLYIIANVYWGPLAFRIQEGKAGQWRKVIDPSADGPI